MRRIHLLRPRWRVVAAGVVCSVALAACGSSAGLGTTSSGGGSMSAMKTTTSRTTGMAMGATGSMSSEDPAGVPAHLLKVDGITPIPTQILTTTDWQHMKIQAMAMTAVPFVVFNGTHERTIKMPKHVSFHLMVTLEDSRSHEPIPYAGVWATITKHGKVVYDERQWPMISEYLGPHYGANVALPGAGTYTLSLLVSPPVSARHIEYENVWLKPHRVTATFKWTPPKA